MRFLLSTLFFSICAIFSFAQERRVVPFSIYTLYDYSHKARDGDFGALCKLFEKSSDTTAISIYYGMHSSHSTNIGHSARALIFKNTIFKPEEIDIYDTSINLSDKLQEFYDRIYYDSTLKAYLVSPINYNDIKEYLLLELKPEDEYSLQQKRDSIFNSPLARKLKVKAYINKKDPTILKELALAIYICRSSALYSDNDHDILSYASMAKLLTGINICIPRTHRDSWIISPDQYTQYNELYHYLKYWLAHYNDYEYNEDQHRFVNTKEKVRPYPKCYKLYQNTFDYQRSIDIASYLELTEQSVEDITLLNSLIYNPEFEAKHLPWLIKLKNYYKSIGINPDTNSLARDYCDSIKNGTTKQPIERYMQADSMLHVLDLEDINALEYWAHIYHVSFAVGTILDKTYSKHWQEILDNTTALKLYLKKCAIFKHLSFEYSSYYIYRFSGASKQVIAKLKNIKKHTKDEDIKNTINLILSPGVRYAHIKPLYNEDQLKNTDTYIKYNRGNDLTFSSIDDTIQSAIQNTTSKNYPNDVVQTCAYALYNQLDTAILVLKSIADTTMNGNTYSSLHKMVHDVHGIPVAVFKTDSDVNAFLQNYHSMAAEALYHYYLKKVNVDLWSNDTLNLDKVYYVLMHSNTQLYDLPIAYAVCRLLQIRFDTTLNIIPRAYTYDTYHSTLSGVSSHIKQHYLAWISYLKERKLISKELINNTSLSYSYAIISKF